MYSKSETNNYGIGFLGVLQIVFVIAKLLNLVSWSWWVVFIPSFVGLGVFLLALIAIIVVALLAKNGKLN